MRAQDSAARQSGTATTGGAPASRKEEALWLLEKMVPGIGVNNLSLAFHVEGRLDPAVLREALAIVMDRHETLRTVFHADETTLTKRVLPRGRVAVETADVADDAVQESLAAFVARPFAFDGRPLLRATHLRGAKRDYFCLAVHHLVFDTYSAGTLREELVAAYDARVAGARVPVALLRKVSALRERPPSDTSLTFWRDNLRDFDPGELQLWIGGQDAAVPTLRGDQVLHEFSETTRGVVQELRQQLRAPETVILLAAYHLLLAKHGAGPNVTVGSPVNVRDHDSPGAIGYHVNVLPLRVAVGPEQSFRDLVDRVRSVFFDGLTHADVPVDHLSNLVPRKGSSWRDALFRHVFNYVPTGDDAAFEIGGLAAEPLLVENGFSKFDLEFFVISTPESLGVRAAYCVEIFDRFEVESLVHRYDDLLVALGADVDRPIGEIDGWSARDREVVGAANATARPVEPATVLEGVLERVAARPDAVAIEYGTDSHTYQQVRDTALATAERLRAAGVGAGDVVAVHAPRCPELAATTLGIWLAGAAYLPLDPSHPDQRITYQLSDSAAKAVLALDPAAVPAGDTGTAVLPMRAEGAGGAAARASGERARPEPDSPAYLIYTSGSTGLPKGTLVSHRSLANLVAHFATGFAITPDDSVLWLTTFSFDISALELFLPLLRGGRVVVAPDEARTDGGVLAGLIGRHGVGTVQATPTTWRLVVEEAGAALASCRVLSGGEPLPAELARRLAAVSGELWNVYGPTETTIWSTMGRVATDPEGPVGVGGPIANTEVFVADPQGRALPVGVRGELCVAGLGVALGYHNRPDLTSERFRQHPSYGRYYRTGDLARWLPDGSLEVIGRTDRQVKLRGNRIELPEVEAVLLGHPEVQAVAAVVVGDPSAEGVLVACVEGEERPGLADQLWQWARERLPPAAVPGQYVFLDTLPMTGNDKVDYPALAREVADRRERVATQHGGDEGGLAGILVGLWRELLGRGDVDADSNFFSYGGHSLLGAQMVQRVEEVTGVRIRLSGLFENPTPRALAHHMLVAGIDVREPGTGSAPPAVVTGTETP